MEAKKILAAGFFKTAALAKAVEKKLKALKLDAVCHVDPDYHERFSESKAEIVLIEYTPHAIIKKLIASPGSLKKPFILILSKKTKVRLPKDLGIFNILPWPCSDQELRMAVTYHQKTMDRPKVSPQHPTFELSVLEEAMEQSNDAVVITDINGTIQYVNNEFQKVTGYTKEEAIGQTPRILKSGFHDRVFYERLWTTIKDGNVFRDLEINKKKNGDLIYVDHSITPIKDPSGKITHFLGTWKDITEKRSMDIALASANREIEIYHKRIEGILNSAHEAIISIGEDQRIAVFNKGAEALFGYAADEIIGQPLEKLIPTRFSHKHQEHVKNFTTDDRTGAKGPKRGPLAGRRKDGTEFMAEITLSKLNDGQRTFFTAFIRDVSERYRMIQELQANEEKYRVVADKTYDWEFWLTPDKQYVYTSPSCERITGCSVDEFRADPGLLRSLVVQEDLPMYDDHIHTVLTAPQPSKMEFRITNRKGDVLWLQHVCQPIFDDAGKFLGTRGSNRDVTEQKRAESAMKESEQSYIGLFNTVNEAIYIQNEDGFFIDVNEGAVNMYGYMRDEFIGRTPDFLSAPGKNDMQAVVDLIKKVFETGKSETFEFWGLRKNGEFFPKEVICNKGKYFGKDVLITTARDITDRKRTEEILESSEKRFRALIENAMEGIALLKIADDDHGFISYVSPSVNRVLGYTPEEILLRDPKELTHSDDMQAILAAMDRVSQKPGEIVSVTYRFQHKNGTWRWLESTITNLLDDPSVASLVFNYRDITEKKKSEARLQQQLAFSNALNKISGTIIGGTEKKEVLLTEMAAIVGQTMKVDRSMIFDVDLTARKVRSVSKWIRPGIADFAPGEETYSLDLFPKSAEKMFHYKQWIQSYSDNRNAVFTGDGSDKLLHDEMGVKSLLWFPFSFDENGFYLLAFNLMQDLRRWTEEELQFLENVSKQVELAIMQSRITYERKKAEQKLEETLQEFETLIEGIPDSITFKDGWGRWLIANAVTEKLFLLESREWYGKTDAELAELHPHMKPVYENCIASDAAAWENEKRTIGSETVIDNDGRPLYFETAKIPLYDKKGSRLGMVVIARDLTFQRQAKELISEQTLILDAAKDAIVMCDLQQYVIYWNKGAEAIYGWTREEAVGRKINDIFCVKDIAWLDAHDIVLRDGSWTGEVTQNTKNGHSIIVENRISLVGDSEGRAKSFLFMNSDVTEKRRMEKQFLRTQRMESIGRMAGGIAHDLNNILTPILMAVQIFRDKVTDESLQRIIAMLENNVLRGADLMKKLLMFTKGAEGELKKINLIDAIREIEKIVRSTFPKNITVVCDVAPQLWPIRGDMTQLHQVLLNLCVNARDAMPAGGQLILEAENIIFHEDYIYKDVSAKPGNYVVLKIADTGTGIPPEVLEHIFEPFFTTKDMEHGTGLGLSTVAAIVKGHEGLVNVYSEIGKGTQFKVYFPAAEAGESEIVSNHTPTIYNGKGESILIVDDEAPIRRVLAAILESHGYKVLEAEDGSKATAIYFANADEIRAVITDMSMPFMDGPTFIRTLRNIRAKCKIIAMSGLPESDREQQLKDLSVDGFIMKPFRSDKILFILHGLLHS